jgi:hypothetical protein
VTLYVKSTVKTEPTGLSGTFVPTYQTKRYHVPEDHNFERERETERERILNFTADKINFLWRVSVINHGESAVGNEF